MSDEALEFLQCVQYDSTTRAVVSVDTTKLARLNATLLDNEAGSSMIASRSDVSTSLPAVLVAVINSSIISAKNRFAALNVLASLSRYPDAHYRTAELFPAVTLMDASFEGLLLDREEANRQFGTALGKPHEHMVVILFRVAGYDALSAADLLQQLCDGDDVMLANLLLGIIRVKSNEWPLLVAAMRCFFELTIPQTYFVASDDNNNNVIQVSSFQQKIASLAVHFLQGNTLKVLGDEWCERWGMCLKQPAEVVAGNLTHFAPVVKYFANMILNVEEFCDQPPLQKTYQQSLLVQLGSTVADFLTSFVATSLRFSPALVPVGGSESSLLVGSLMCCMRVLRLAYFRPSRGLAPPLVRSVCALVDAAVQRIVVLRQTPLIPVLLLLLEVLANVNASSHTELDPALQLLLATIASDDSRVIGTASLSQTLSTLFLNETSVFVVMENETTRAITAGLCGAALDDLVDEIIQYIDRELITLGIGPSVFEFFIPGGDPQDLVFVPTPTQPEAIEPSRVLPQAPRDVTAAPLSPPLATSAAPGKHRVKKNRHKTPHPKEFVCMLSGKLMREPVVIKKTGNRFELEELERVIADVGHVDPITFEAFDEDPEVDLALQRQIQQYKVLRASKKKYDE